MIIQINSGAPSKDVNTPIGISSGLYMARESTSAHIITILPMSGAKISNRPCLGPPTMRVRNNKAHKAYNAHFCHQGSNGH